MTTTPDRKPYQKWLDDIDRRERNMWRWSGPLALALAVVMIAGGFLAVRLFAMAADGELWLLMTTKF